MTVKAIDKQFQNRSLTVKNKEEIETTANESQQLSTRWMKTMIYQSMKVGLEGGLGGLQGNPKISAKQRKQRLNQELLSHLPLFS